jgi:transposase
MFLEKTMDEMDCFFEQKGYYIIMDNAPIHTVNQIDEMIVARGYKSIYLSPYSPELNLIEQL